MPWDLTWHRHKDLEFTAKQDIAIVSSDELLEQRIIVRLVMMRGWIYDTTGELGSNLYTALVNPMEETDNLPSLVLEALEPMSNEITVQDVIIRGSLSDSRAQEVIIVYVKNNQLGSPQPSTNTLIFPLR